MRDAVADVLEQRAGLDRGGAAAFVISILLHASLVGIGVFAAFTAAPPKAPTMVNIQFASTPATPRPPTAPPSRAVAAPVRPIEAAKPPEEPKPQLAEPQPQVAEVPKPAKNTVPLSPFGRSTKKGSETPPARDRTAAPTAPAPAAANVPPGVATDVPVGAAGVTGLEGGDFPYALYIDAMQRRIGSNWLRPQVGAGTATIVYFRIQRNGSISDIDVTKSSGNSTFDRAARSAVASSNPLNPLPFGYSGTYLGVHLTFR